MNRVLTISLICCLFLTVFCYQVESKPVKQLGKFRQKEQPVLPDYLPEKKDNGFTLPAIPEKRVFSPAGPVFLLKGVVFEGNTVFSNQALNQVAILFLNREVGMADLEELRYQITKLYVDKGFPNSGALIKPGQTVDDGVVTYEIIEGHLNEISIAGNGRLSSDYIRKRIWPDTQAVFNTDVLQERFQMLLQDPLIDRMRGRILPGRKPGDAILGLDVTRKKPYELNLIADNHSPPGLGAERLLLDGTLRNLTGFGDSLDLLLGLTRGTKEMGSAFSIPLFYRNMLTIGYNRSDNNVVEAPLDELDIESELESFRVSFNHSVYQSLEQKFDLGVTLETEESKTSLLGRPFSFSEGYVDGRSQLSALRFIQSYQDRSLDYAFVLRSTLSIGMDLFGSTIHSDGRIDSQFVAWLGQLQHAHRLGENWGQIIFRGDIQIADDRLLPMEQFSVGGATTVRGYRENEIVRDNGYAVSLEWRIPLWEGKARENGLKVLQIAPFIDYGSGWDKGGYSDNRLLSSAGVGLLWTSRRINAEVYFAHGFEEVFSKGEHDLQDDGIHFSVTINLL
jgi:hemolysin activation/secretion protein